MCECASVCVDILGCVICCVKTQLQATSESFMCVSSLASRPDTDLTMFSKQSQHTDFFMLYFGFCSLWIVFFLALALVLGFCFHIRSQCFFLYAHHISTCFLWIQSFSVCFVLPYFVPATTVLLFKRDLMIWLRIYLLRIFFSDCVVLSPYLCMLFLFVTMRWSKYVRIFSENPRP